MKNKFALILAACSLLISVPSMAAGAEVAIDPAPIKVRDTESLQRGAKTFVNYCLSCHGAIAMRYNRLMDLGLSEEQIKQNMMFAADKVGETMKVGMTAKDGAVWLGAAPPDLSVLARSRGADWLYTYMRSFYRDSSRPSGWNNAAFDKVGMPHVLWQQQGDLELKVSEGKAPANPAAVRRWETVEHADGKEKVLTHELVLVKAGELTRLDDGKANTLEYDRTAADLVNYLVWMGEPAQISRERIGYGVLLFLLFLLIPLVYFLKREIWKDVH